MRRAPTSAMASTRNPAATLILVTLISIFVLAWLSSPSSADTTPPGALAPTSPTSYLLGVSYRLFPQPKPDIITYGCGCIGSVNSWRLKSIEWSDWGVDSAHGSGRLDPYPWTAPNTPDDGVLVSISLTKPVGCYGRSVFSAADFTLAPGATAPAYFAALQHTDFPPCQLVAGVNPPMPTSAAGGACNFGIFGNGHTSFKIRGFGFGAFCRLKWANWGGATSVGSGVYRIGDKLYGGKVVLSQIMICPAQGATYTQLQGTFFGDGKKYAGSALKPVSKRVANQFRGLVGKRGQPRHSFHRQFPKTRKLCV